MAALAAFTDDARAEDPAIIALVSDDTSPGSPEQFLLFSGVDLWRASASAYGGLQLAPGGLNEDGLVVRLLLSRNLERYADTRTLTFRAAGLAVVRGKQGEFELKLMAGPQLESHDPTSPAASLRGTRLGLQASRKPGGSRCHR